MPDAGEVDAGGTDAGTEPDAPMETIDGGGGDGGIPTGPIACTPATATVLCGARPCVDGYCCDGPCDGACRSCALAGSEGECTLVAALADPDAECAVEAPATCGTIGTCDGAGACAHHPATVTCDDGMACTSGDLCDGSGTCRGAAPTSCAPGAGNECCLASCGGSGCITTAGTCADVCGGAELRVGRACGGCGGAGASGLCQGGAVHPCDATNHDLCRAVSCGGSTYTCTNQGGTWAWRTTSGCDDGNACTHSDACAAGSCTGTSVTCTSTNCMTRACNGTASCTSTPRTGMTCDDGNACSYNDACNAGGTCAGGSTVTCTDSACLDRECNGTATCTETVRTGGACDDGMSCTYGEACNAAGACTGGSVITCDSMDTTCRDFSCNGTATCASAARNVGGTCDDGMTATTGDVCRSDGSCMGSVGCPPPTVACTNGAESRDRCTGARTIGRTVAATAPSYFTISGSAASTCSASNRFDSSCWDANADHAYRLYMRAGERATVRLRTQTACIGGSWSGTIKIFENAGCADTACTTEAICNDGGSDINQAYTATRDGWVIIVVDGYTAFDDEGQYRLDVTLTCNVAGCEC